MPAKPRPDSEFISLATLVDESGLSLPTVRKLLRQADLKPRLGRGGGYPARAARKALKQVDAAMVAGHTMSGRGAVKITGPVSDFAHHRSASESVRTELLALKLQEQRGKLIDRRAVVDAGLRIVRRTVAAFKNFGVTMAPLVQGQTDALKIAAIADAEVARILLNLADLERLDREALE